jgi:hypothetical protein
MPQKATRKFLMGFAVAIALGCSSGAIFAGTDRVEELEERVAELEALVHQLLENQQAVETVEIVELKAPAEASAELIAEKKISEMMADHHAPEEEKARKHSFKVGGYVKADLIYSDYGDGSVASGSMGRDFYFPSTVPVGGESENYFDMHSKETRINLKTMHNMDSGAMITTFVEVDFLGSKHGDERVSNSYNPRLRHAFLTYGNWLFGQTWMTLFNVAALPDNLDFIGPSESTIFGRQTQIRYTHGSWQFSVENPETTVTPYGGGERIIADDNRVPDFVARYNMHREWGNFTLAGIYRELRCEDNAAGIKDSASGYGISLSGKFKIGERDDFRWMASTGKGLGRYIGLNTSNAAVLDSDGYLKAIDSTGVFGSFRHFWSPEWRSNLTLGYLAIDNRIELTGIEATRKASSVHVNLIYNPQPRLDFGIEFLYADREIESGADGDLTRVQFSAKYAY